LEKLYFPFAIPPLLKLVFPSFGVIAPVLKVVFSFRYFPSSEARFPSFGVIAPVLIHRKKRGNDLKKRGNSERKIRLFCWFWAL
jgi:hypothetical protein